MASYFRFVSTPPSDCLTNFLPSASAIEMPSLFYQPLALPQTKQRIVCGFRLVLILTARYSMILSLTLDKP